MIGAMAATASEAIGAIKLVQALALDGQFAQLFGHPGGNQCTFSQAAG